MFVGGGEESADHANSGTEHVIHLAQVHNKFSFLVLFVGFVLSLDSSGGMSFLSGEWVLIVKVLFLGDDNIHRCLRWLNGW